MQSLAKSICFLILCAATVLVVLGGRFTTPARRSDRVAASPADALTTAADSSPAESPATALVDQVTLALKTVPLDQCAIEVEINAGIVILKGLVVTNEQKTLTEAMAARVPGILHVENQLRIQSPKLVERTNRDLATVVKDAIKYAIKGERLTGYEIDISVVNKSEVTLAGQVTKAEHRVLIEQAATLVSGIRRVENRLVVAGEPLTKRPLNSSNQSDTLDRFFFVKGTRAFKVSNQQMAEIVHHAIKEAFAERPEEDSSIEIMARQGGVRLEGSVRTAQMKAGAEEAARSVPGVVYVENLLTVTDREASDPSRR